MANQHLKALGVNPFDTVTEDPGGIFSIRGDLDGEKSGDFTEREQFIGVLIGEEEFLIPIQVVSEIVMLKPITFVPQGPHNIDGVINLRGRIIPAINLRKIMNVSRGEVTSATRIIIVSARVVEEPDMVAGLLVDGITFVASLLPNQIQDQSIAGKTLGNDFISRLSKVEEKVTGIIDINRLVVNASGGKLTCEEVEEPKATEF